MNEKNDYRLKKEIFKSNKLKGIIKVGIIAIFFGIVICSSCLFYYHYFEYDLDLSARKIYVELGKELPDDKSIYLDYFNKSLTNLSFFYNVKTDSEGHTSKVGSYLYQISYRNTNKYFAKEEEVSSIIEVIDTTPPTITLLGDKFEYTVDDEVKIEDLATCSDLSNCTLTFKEEVDNSKDGMFIYTIVSTDDFDNKVEYDIIIIFNKKPEPIIKYYADNTVNNNRNSSLSIEEKEALRKQVIDYAAQFVGNPYKMGGNSLTEGTDCSGFTSLVYAHFGYQLDRSSLSQSANGVGVSREELKPGDIIVYNDNGMGHVALYYGNGKIVHAATPSKGIVLDYIYAGNIIAYRRIIY